MGEWTYTTAVKRIREIYSSEEYNKLQAKLSHTTYLEAMGNHRWEVTYSSLLKWIFSNPEFDLNRGLQDTQESPIVFLLRLLAAKAVEPGAQNKPKLPKEELFDGNITLLEKILINDVTIDVNHVQAESEADGSTEKKGKKDSIDLDIECDAKYGNGNEHIRILLENKVDSCEGKKQCKKYYNYFNSHKKGAVTHLYVFLSPEKNPDNLSLTDDHFIKISYQDLLDNVLMPILHQSEHYSELSRRYLQDFIDTITSIKSSGKGNIAMDPEVRELLIKFFTDNEELIYSAVNEGTDDKDEKEQMSGLTKKYNLSYNNTKNRFKLSVAKVAYEAVQMLREDDENKWSPQYIVKFFKDHGFPTPFLKEDNTEGFTKLPDNFSKDKEYYVNTKQWSKFYFQKLEKVLKEDLRFICEDTSSSSQQTKNKSNPMDASVKTLLRQFFLKNKSLIINAIEQGSDNEDLREAATNLRVRYKLTYKDKTSELLSASRVALEAIRLLKEEGGMDAHKIEEEWKGVSRIWKDKEPSGDAKKRYEPIGFDDGEIRWINKGKWNKDEISKLIEKLKILKVSCEEV